MFVYMSDVIILENSLVSDHEIIYSEFGKVTLTKMIAFLSNICSTAIYLRSHKIPYMVIMEYANISFINNTVHHQTIRYDYNNIFPYCIFQYMLSINCK